MSNKKLPKVTIAVPIYKVEKYINRCATSLFEQNYENLEFIFIDDCSPDNSIVVLRSVIDKYSRLSNKVKIVHHTRNKGLACARNTAVDEAKGDFIFHVDSDDYIEPNCIEKIVHTQLMNDADVVITGFNNIYEDGKQIKSIPKKAYNTTEEWVHAIIRRDKDVSVNIWGKLIRVSLYKKNDIYIEAGINMSEDYNVICRLAYYCQRVSFVNDCLYNYNRTNENSYSNKFSLSSHIQIMKSLDILQTFFVSKNNMYKNSFRIGRLRSEVASIIELCLNSLIEDYSLKEPLSRISSYNKTEGRYIAIHYRPLLYIHNVKILRLYVCTIKHIIRIYKSLISKNSTL